MELLNVELVKLQKPHISIKQKDYSTLHNTIVHMLEEKNQLVFMEAVRAVELLSILFKH